MNNKALLDRDLHAAVPLHAAVAQMSEFQEGSSADCTNHRVAGRDHQPQMGLVRLRSQEELVSGTLAV